MFKQLRMFSAAATALMAAILVAAPARATITTSVTFNSTSNLAGITAWPSAPTVNVTALASSPGAFMAVTEGNLGNAIDGFSFSQSFTATTSGKLTKVQLPITGQAPQTFHFHVYDGLMKDWTDIPIYDPDMNMTGDPYVPGVDVSNDLLTDTTAQTWNGYTLMGATAAVLDVSLSGADQVNIVSGQTYIVEFELDATFNNMLFIGRNSDNALNYTGGQAFRSRKPLNGNSLRDIAMAFTVSSGVLAGDFNEMNGVEASDLTAWKGGFGATSGATHGQGDANADGDVDGGDFLVWQQQLGQTSALGAAVSAPEPGAAALALAAAAGLLTRRRRSR